MNITARWTFASQLLPIFAAIFAAPAVAQQRAVPVDTNATAIRPQQFSSPQSLFSHLRIEPKGEFETTGEFADRVAHAVGGASYVFRVSVAQDPSYCDGSIEYNADLARMTYRLPTIYPAGADHGVPVQCTATGGGTYLASNAMGAKIRVTRFIRTLTEFTTDNENFLFDEGSLELSPDAARALKPYVRLAVLVSPGTGTSGLPAESTTGETEPDFQDPYDVTYRVSSIRSAQIEALLYDVRTGKILSRAKPPAAPTITTAFVRTVAVKTVRYQDANEKPRLLTGEGGDGHLAVPTAPSSKGFVDIAFDILEDGSVANAVVKNSSDPLLANAALVAVGKRTYSPGIIAGRPVAVAMQQLLSVP